MPNRKRDRVATMRYIEQSTGTGLMEIVVVVSREIRSRRRYKRMANEFEADFIIRRLPAIPYTYLRRILIAANKEKERRDIELKRDWDSRPLEEVIVAQPSRRAEGPSPLR